MKKRLPALILLIFCFGNSSRGQQHLVDSLTKQLQGAMADSNRAMSMMRLAIDYEVVDTAKAYAAYRDAIAFTTEKKLYYQLGRTYQNHAYLLKTAGNYTASIANLQKAILNYRKVNTSKARKWEANAYGDIANDLKNQNDIEQSIDYNLKSISMLEALGFKDEATTRYCNLASLFADIREFEKQKEYAHKALVTAKSTGKRMSLHMAYVTVTHAYIMLHDYKLAKTYLDSARMYFDKNVNIDLLLTYHLIAAQTYRVLDQLDSAFYYFATCLEESRQYNYAYGRAESQLQMGAVSILQKKYADAERYLLAGIKEAEAVHYFNILDEGYKYLSDIYAVTGRYKLAYEYFQKYKETNDSVVDMDSKKYVTSLEKKYETEKKSRQILQQETQLQKGRILNYILFTSAVILIILIFLSYRAYQQKQKLQQQRISELEIENQLAAAEAVMRGEEQERTRLAKDLHDGLGGMLSGIKYSFKTMKDNLIMTPDNQRAFERSIDMLDSSIKEMRRVAHNMMPESLVKFGLDTALRDFCNDITKSGALQIDYQSLGVSGETFEQTTAITIYRIIQELLNNVLKHAAAKTALVQVTKTGQQLAVTVEDDGAGFDTALLQQPRGIGWENIRHRVDFLKGKIDVHSQRDKGTSVYIEFTV